jgi:hypothetical protein
VLSITPLPLYHREKSRHCPLSKGLGGATLAERNPWPRWKSNPASPQVWSIESWWRIILGSVAEKRLARALRDENVRRPQLFPRAWILFANIHVGDYVITMLQTNIFRRCSNDQICRLKNSVLWDITPCSPLKVNQSFCRTYSLHLQPPRLSQAKNQRESRWQGDATLLRAQALISPKPPPSCTFGSVCHLLSR